MNVDLGQKLSGVVRTLPTYILIECALEKIKHDSEILKRVIKTIYNKLNSSCRNNFKELNNYLEFACIVGDLALVEYIINKSMSSSTGKLDIDRNLVVARKFGNMSIVKFLTGH